MTIAHGPSPAPTKTCSVIGGQWTKSHCFSGRSSPSITSTHSPETTRKSSWAHSPWYMQFGSPGRRTTSWKPSSSNSASPSRFADRPWPSRPLHFTSRALTTKAVVVAHGSQPSWYGSAPVAEAGVGLLRVGRFLEHARAVLRGDLVDRVDDRRRRSLRLPTMTITHGPSPAPTKTCSAIGGQWTKSQACRWRSSPSRITMHSPDSDEKSSWSDSPWYMQFGWPGSSTSIWKPSSSNPASLQRSSPGRARRSATTLTLAR